MWHYLRGGDKGETCTDHMVGPVRFVLYDAFCFVRNYLFWGNDVSCACAQGDRSCEGIFKLHLTCATYRADGVFSQI